MLKLLLGVVALLFCFTAQAQSADELYRLAQQKREVSLYGGGPAILYTGWARVSGRSIPASR
jgi:hypothetical protein